MEASITLPLVPFWLYIIYYWSFRITHRNVFTFSKNAVAVAIRLPTDATIYFVCLFPFLPYMFRALISPSSGVPQAVFIYNHLVPVLDKR